MASDVIVGFIGLGTMGGKMATNLLKAGYRVVVHDLHRQSAGHHLQAGSAWADTPRALAEQSDVVFTSLPPVSGGPSGAASGKMAIWVGGDPPDFALKLATKDVALATASWACRCGSAISAMPRCRKYILRTDDRQPP